MGPTLSLVERDAIEQTFKAGGNLFWKQVCGEDGYGGGYICYCGHKRLFASGSQESFSKLYQQALDMRPNLTPKEIAQRLIVVLSDAPHGSRRLAELAGIEYSDVVKTILRKLYEAGKIQKITMEDGKVKWTI